MNRSIGRQKHGVAKRRNRRLYERKKHGWTEIVLSVLLIVILCIVLCEQSTAKGFRFKLFGRYQATLSQALHKADEPPEPPVTLDISKMP